MTRQTTYISDLGRLSDYFDSFFVGYDSLMNNLYNVGSKTLTQSNYPPADVVKVDEYNYRIDIAAAGFSGEELSVDVADNVLTIKGEKTKPEVNQEDEETYIHKKIAYRNFQKEYTLNPEVVVTGADHVDGILSVHLHHEVPEHKKPKSITINQSKS